MEKIITILEVIMPILAAVGLGMLARHKNLISAEGIGGFQKFVMQFGLPCVVFNSCLLAQMGQNPWSVWRWLPLSFLWGLCGPSVPENGGIPIIIFLCFFLLRKRVCWVFLW